MDAVRIAQAQPRSILVSAGEASGDLYAAQLVVRLRECWPEADFFGCTGPRLREAGVRTLVDAHSLAVVGLVEVAAHIPRIYGEFRRLVDAARADRPDLAILTDSPDFHLRVARKLKAQGIPVVYLVAPQVWAWRKGRLPAMRQRIDQLLCIFPFEEEFFQQHGIRATYIGHPLTRTVRPKFTKEEFFQKHRLPASRPLVVVLPGSRQGEAGRHLPPLLEAVQQLYSKRPVSFLLPASATAGAAFFRERVGGAPVEVIEGETWDAMAHADLALAASGTVTVEAAILGTPMVTFYRVAGLSWLAGRLLLDVPYYCMVNLIAGRKVVPELMQGEMTGANLAAEAERLLGDQAAREEMKAGLSAVRARLETGRDPMERAAEIVRRMLEQRMLDDG